MEKYAQEFIQSIDGVGFKAINKFISFLSFYIHSVGYEWDWEKYLMCANSIRMQKTHKMAIDKDEEDKTASRESVKTIYLWKNLVAELQQLALAAKMQEVLPKELHEYIGAETANFKYNSAESLGHADSQIILDRIKENVTSEQLLSLISSSSTQIESSGDLLFDIVYRSILFIAQYISSGYNLDIRKTIEHVNKLMERYAVVIKNLMKDEAKLFDITFEMYSHSEILFKYTIEKLLTYGLISPVAVIKRVCATLTLKTESTLLW